MKQWVMSFLVLSFSLNSWSAPGGPSDLESYIQNPPTGRTELNTLQGQLVNKIWTEPDTEYEMTVHKLGDEWTSHPDLAYPVIEKLQLAWDVNCAAPMEIASQEAKNTLLVESAIIATFSFLLSLYKPARLPQIIAAYLLMSPANAHSSSCKRRAPFEILSMLASSRSSLNEAVARESDDRTAEVAATMGWTIGSLAFRAVAIGAEDVATATFSASRAAKLLVVLSALSYGVYLAADTTSYALREHNILGDWQEAASQLQTALLNPSNAINPAAKNFYLATLRAYDFYSYDVSSANQNIAHGDASKETSDLVRDSYQSACAADVDKRFFLKYLISGRTEDAQTLLRTGSIDLAMSLDGWIRKWQRSQTAITLSIALENVKQARRDFLNIDGAKVDFLKKLEADVKYKWAGCHDGLYFLFTVDDWLDNWAVTKPGLFTQYPDLGDAKLRVESALFRLHESRRTYLAGTKDPIPRCGIKSDRSVCRTPVGVIRND